jgi:hypothetical protein
MIYRHIVHSPTGWIATKARYSNKEIAQSWTSFVKKAWHGLPVKLIEINQENIDKYDLNRNYKSLKSGGLANE